MIGFPEDTEYSIRQVLRYAMSLGPTFANFNVVTPYPGTAFFDEMRDRLDTIDYSRFNVYTPLLKYEHLTPRQVESLLGKCFQHYYFRWRYLKENTALLWPGLRRLGFGAEPRNEVLEMKVKADGSRPSEGLRILPVGRMDADCPEYQAEDERTGIPAADTGTRETTTASLVSRQVIGKDSLV